MPLSDIYLSWNSRKLVASNWKKMLDATFLGVEEEGESEHQSFALFLEFTFLFNYVPASKWLFNYVPGS